MFDWIIHNRGVFNSSYVAIGHSYQEAKKLQDDHNTFTMTTNVRPFSRKKLNLFF